jgi:hypothetical protein
MRVNFVAGATPAVPMDDLRQSRGLHYDAKPEPNTVDPVDPAVR